MNISSATGTIADQTYSGSVITLTKSQITITVNGTTLTDSDFTIISYTDNDKVGTASVTVNGVGNYTGTLNIEFNISAQTYTVTFKDYNDSVIDTQTVAYGSSATAPSVSERIGYTFSGWDKDFSNITEDTIVTAQYTINTYTITFETDGGTVISSQEITHGGKVEKPTNPEKYGYMFIKWCTDSNYKTEYSFDSIVTSDLTLYAEWSLNKYKVTFETNGGSLLPTLTYEHGDKVTKPTDPTKEGSEFVAWYIDSSFTSEYDFNSVLISDITLYAKWNTPTYTIIFETNEGSIIDNQYIEYGGLISKPTDPTKDGYTFAGWYTDTTYVNIFNFNNKIYEDITIYAKWTIENQLMITGLQSATTTYNGSEISENVFDISVKVNGNEVNDATLVYKYSTDGGTTYTDGLPTNAGTYRISVIATHTTYTTSDEFIITLNIGKKPLKISQTPIEIDYDSANRTWSLLSGIINNKVVLIDSSNNIITLPTTDSITIQYMHDGKYLFGTYDNAGEYDTSMTNVVGSTYLGYFYLDSQNYYIDKTLNNIGTTIIKYKTALVNNTYFTIEDAFNQNGTITMIGDSSGENTYVATAFTSLSSAEGNPYYKTSFDLINRTLHVPYANNLTVMENGTDYRKSGNVYSALIIPLHIIINMSGSSTLNAAAYIGFSTATKVCQRGVIMNDGTINVGSGGKVNAYGYIKGNGTIIMESGSTAVDCMAIYDWPGGTNAMSMVNNGMPMNSWSTHNNSCTTVIKSGAVYNAYIHMLLDIKISVEKVEETFTVVGNYNTSNCLFKPVGSGGQIIKKAAPATSWTSSHASYIALYSITGSNQIKGQKDIIEIDGEYTDATLSISAGVGIFQANMKTSTSLNAPLGYMDVTIKSGSQLSLTSSDYLFLPGTSVTIEKGAEVTVGANVDLSFELWSITNAAGGGFKSHCIDKYDAKFIVNGTLISAGNIGGQIITEVEGAILNLSSGSASSSYITMDMSLDSKFRSGTLNALGTLDDVEGSTLSASAYISIPSTTGYGWTEAGNTNSFNIIFNDDNGSLIENKTILVVNTDQYIVDGSELEPTRLHYDFVGWLYNGILIEDLTEDIILTTTNSTVTLVASWTIHEYEISYSAGYNSEYIEPTYENILTKFTISDFENNILTITTTATYLGKNFKGWYIGIDSSSNKQLSSITLEQFEMFISEYNMNTPLPLYCEFTDEVYYSVTIIDDKYNLINFTGDVLYGNKISSNTYINNVTFNNDTIDNDFGKEYYFNGFIDELGNIYNTYDDMLNHVVTANITYKAQWEKKYTVTYLQYDNTDLDSNNIIYVKPNTFISLRNSASRNSVSGTTYDIDYTFKGWNIEDNIYVWDNNSNYYAGNYKVIKDINAIATYEEQKVCSITFTLSNATVQYSYGSLNNQTANNGQVIYVPYETLVTFTFTYSENYSQSAKFNGSNFNNGDVKTITSHSTVNISSSGCFTEGTLITMADGSTKKVEDICLNDYVLAIDHTTGKLVASKVLSIWDHGGKYLDYNVINLVFDDGTTLKIVAKHGLFDSTLNKYIFINETNYMDFIDHNFVKYNSISQKQYIKLVNAYITCEKTRIFTIVSENTLNLFAEDILTVAPPTTIESDGLVNIFHFDDNLKYDEYLMNKDIETYGLYQYSDFEQYLSYEEFVHSPIKYLKISVGKGLISYEEIIYLINYGRY